ncbi:MAG: AIM24 family protein, partial [Oscillospiraceae bacterium]|nr:AIM24 family protein [Oscillospiraceae bacterium]
GAGLFGGEGFIMQKISGSGIAFLEFDGSIVEYELEAGQQIVVDTGNLAIMDATCTVDIETVKGVKNVLFGGEGLFNTVVTGPGKVTLQTMPLSSFAASLAPYFPSSSS